MKKTLVLLLAVIMLGSAVMTGQLPVHAATGEVNSNVEDASIIDITDSELMSMESATSLIEHMNNMGIIVIRHSEYTNSQIASKLNMSMTIREQESGDTYDAASLYYTYGAGKKGVYIINVQTSNTSGIDDLITEAVGIIQERQATSQIAMVDNTTSAESLGMVDVTTTIEPKGKLRASYEIFTVQNYHELDFYVVKANISGLPGCVLASDNSNFKKAYQIENMSATISTPTTSTTLDAYGPHRTIESSSYSVDIGLSIDSDETIGISGGWSYSRNIEDTDIDASCTDKKASWDVTLRDEAQKTSFTFEPSASFKCPYNKASIEINVSASCVFDSWFAFEETASYNRTIVCTPTSASVN